MNAMIRTFALVALTTPYLPVAAQTCNPSIPLDRPDSRYTDNGSGTITDNVTGLMWMQCPEGVGTTTTVCDTGSAAAYTWQGALTQAQSVNVSGFATYRDWRLPSIKELKSLTETACYEPSINAALFPATPSWGFWSASPIASNTSYAWILGFHSGNAGWGGKGDAYYVHLVRAGR